MSWRVATCATAMGAGLVACASGLTASGKAFDTNWKDDNGASIRTIQTRIANHEIPTGANVAIGIVEQGLVGLDLSSGHQWHFAHALDARPTLVGNLVVGTGDGQVFALNAKTGKVIWKRQSPGRLVGAGDDGRTTVVSLKPSLSNSGILVAIVRDGSVVRQVEANVSLGTPAVVANLVFIPWGGQHVTVYELTSGQEIARAVMPHPTGHAFVAGGSLYFGEAGVTRFDAHIGDASKNEATKLTLPERELPGTPRWFTAGGSIQKTFSNAYDKVRIYARPGSVEGGLGFDRARYYATYYRIVVGLHGQTGKLIWVKRVDNDAIGGAAYEGGLALCQRSGEVSLFDGATGSCVGSFSLGARLRACVVQADSMKTASTSSTKSLADQIAEAVDSTDTELLAMQTFLINELIAQDSAAATRRLIELASDSRTPNSLLRQARKGLAMRRTGAELMLEALQKRYDFLEGVLMAPPVGPLADALCAMKESKAAPLLAQHLNDPANTTDDVKRAALALEKLATAAEQEQLETFFSLNRATAHNQDMVAAVIAVAKAILRLGGEQGRELVNAAAHDVMTVPKLQKRLGEL